MTAQLSPPRPTRRRVLHVGATSAAAVGVAAALPGRAVAASPSTGCPVAGTAGSAVAAGAPSPMFGRMFGNLPPFAENSAGLRSALLAIGAPGGPLDAGDDLFGPNGGPVKLITDPNLSLINKNNPHDSAGMTFLGQFIDHDLTFDATSKLGVAADPAASPNSRTARFDLDSVYGLGPIVQPELYDPASPVKLLLETGGRFEDLPRRADRSAVIGDVRNDSNLMVSGLHAAFCAFHNNAVDHVSAPGREPLDVFAAARKLTTWHYQWLVVNRILPNFVGRHVVEDVLHRGTRFFHPYQSPFIPVEFSGAAYRFGHSMVRPSYRANLAGDNGQPFFGLIFDSRVVVPDGQNPASDPGDLRGGFRSSRRFVGWQTFFDFGGAYTADVRPNKIIDTTLSTPLFALPTSAIAHVPGAPGPIALPQRTLLRHLTWSLPSGQDIADAMGIGRLSAVDLEDFGKYGHHLDTSTPLWLYVLREADLVNAGRFLGPVGGRIVAETMIGLLRAHPDSYLFTRPSWQPVLGARPGSDYEIADFLRFAGVDPDSRGE